MTTGATGNAAAAGEGSVRYYLFLNGLDGGSTDKGFENAFEVTAAELGVLAGGKPLFDMLELKIRAGSSLDELARNVMNGVHIPTAQLVAVTGSGETEEIVGELKLADVLVGHVGFGSGNTTSVGLRYSSIEVGSDNGKAFESFGWNLNAASELTSPIGTPVAGDENATGNFGKITWSLIFSGLDGGGTGGAFVVNGFDLSMDNTTTTGSGTGSGTGKFSLGDLNLSLEFGSASDEIMRLLMAGLHTDAVQLVGKAGGQTVYDLRMAEVVVTKAQIDSGGADTLSLESRVLSLTTTNAAGTSETVRYNAATTEIDSTQLGGALATPEDGLNQGKTTWYLLVDGLDGGSRVKGHEGAFALSGFSFGGVNPGSKFTADELSLSFEAGSNLDELLGRLVTGTHISAARIVGDTIVGTKVISDAYDLRLSTVQVMRAEQDTRGPDSFVFDYSAMSLTTKNLQGVSETRSYDKQTTELGTDPLTPAVASTAEAGATPSKATDYYMVIGGLDGGVSGKPHNLAFAINDFTISAEMIDSGSGTGSGSGKAEFGALTVDLDLGSSLTQLMERIADGTIFALQIVGDDPRRTGKSIVYDLRFDAATLQSLESGTGHDQLIFDYGSYSLTTLNGDGDAETTGINRATTEIITQPLAAAQGANLNATPDQPMKYFLVLDGIDGGVTAKGHKGAFAINSFDFDMLRDSDKTSSTLNLKLDLGSAEDELLKLAATGTHLISARIVGDTIGKNGKPNVYDLRLGDLIVSEVDRDASNRDELSLNYGEASLSTKNGKGQTVTSAYDFITDTVSTTPLNTPKAGSENWLGAGKTTYWLVLDGIHSGEGGKKHAGAFALDDFAFSVANPAVPGVGGGSGKAVFSLLEAILDSGSASDELLSLIAKGTHLSSAQIIGEAKVGKTVHTVYDLRISDVTVASYGLLDDDSIGLDYGAFTLSTMNSKHKMETYGFDLDQGTSLTTPLAPPAVGEL